jgi:hypothetical protein
MLQAHKLLLSISSPVFEALFYGPMSDKNLKDVKLDDVKPSGFRTVHLLPTFDSKSGGSFMVRRGFS